MLVVIILSISVGMRDNSFVVPEFVDSVVPEGTALIITGAAARISQEVGLIEELHKRGLLNDLVFISGVSSGALNAVMLNGILDGKISWEEYKTILFELKTEDIFIQDKRRIPVNTSPARELFKNIVEGRLDYQTIGELPVATAITITHLRGLGLKRFDYRLCSRKMNTETDTCLGLVDIMMASSAFPLVFPPVRINNVSSIPNVNYVDGGAGDDRVPYMALLQFQENRGKPVKKVFIVSRNCDTLPNLSEELMALGINDKGIFDRLGVSLDALLTREFLKRLEEYSKIAPEMVSATYVWVPEIHGNFPLFNFENLKEQYELTVEWAQSNEPVSLTGYLEQKKPGMNPVSELKFWTLGGGRVLH